MLIDSPAKLQPSVAAGRAARDEEGDGNGWKALSDSPGKLREPGARRQAAETRRRERRQSGIHGFWKGKTRFQSCFMSTTVQPFALASSSALSRVPIPEARSYAHSRVASV